MPIAYPVTLFGCRFKCGGRRSQNRKLIEKHEETCFANPERRACKTCKHDHKGRIDEEDNDCYCELDFGKPEGESLREYESTKMTCRANCPAWEAKKETE